MRKRARPGLSTRIACKPQHHRDQHTHHGSITAAFETNLQGKLLLLIKFPSISWLHTCSSPESLREALAGKPPPPRDLAPTASRSLKSSPRVSPHAYPSPDTVMRWRSHHRWSTAFRPVLDSLPRPAQLLFISTSQITSRQNNPRWRDAGML